MTQKKLLYIAAAFTLLTFVGHSLGTLLPQKPETEALAQAYEVMNNTVLTMPFGPPRSLALMAYGGNVFISLYLLVSGFLFILIAKHENTPKSFILLNSSGVAVCAALSLIYFFPLPAIFTAIAAMAGFMTALQKQNG